MEKGGSRGAREKRKGAPTSYTACAAVRSVLPGQLRAIVIQRLLLLWPAAL